MLQSLFRAVLGEDAKWLQGLDLRFKILVLDPFGGAKMLPLDEKSSTKKILQPCTLKTITSPKP